MTTSEAEAQLEVDLSHVECALDAENVVKLFTFDKVEEDRKAGKPEGTVFTGELKELITDYQGGEFSLFFVNCQAPTVVSFDIRVSLYNVRNGVMDYLSVGEGTLPTMYMVLFVLFCMSAALWSAVVVKARANAHRIHIFMIILVAFKSLTLLSQAGMYHLIRIHGHPEGWNIAFYVFTFMRGILFFSVVVLVGTGWSYMKPLLAEKEKRILMVVIPLQVFAEVAIIILDENTPASRSWFTWRDILHLVDIICCCAILFPIVWSIKHLREASQSDGKAARSLVKLTLFRQFYVMVVSYIYFTRIVVYLLKSTMPFQYVWISDAAGELATLAFYVMTGLKFRPHANNPYFLVNDSDIDPQELARYV
ncbi:hypothetical protein WJX72_005424 [[Myrmecia] bisecta]|uniref:Uncharacterized protein n=1 Tax=[Myrmecia] bisecta TaxID=41462 RepID=A0AAW1Q797_9CHLO